MEENDYATQRGVKKLGIQGKWRFGFLAPRTQALGHHKLSEAPITLSGSGVVIKIWAVLLPALLSAATVTTPPRVI